MQRSSQLTILFLFSMVFSASLNKSYTWLTLNTDNVTIPFPDHFGVVRQSAVGSASGNRRLYNFQDSSETDKAEELEVWLERFIAQSREFFSNFFFSADDFGAQVVMLNRELLEITRLAEKASQCRRLSSLLAFAQRMFHTMVNSWENMNYYNSRERQDHRLVSRVSELNVSILSLYDDYGLPNYNTKGYGRAVRRLSSLVRTLKARYHSLKQVSFSTQAMFLMQITRAEESLALLTTSIV